MTEQWDGIFTVVDNKTGKYPDVEKIALEEEWAQGLMWCDIDCFVVSEDGGLALTDDCGVYRYPPVDRFTLIPRMKPFPETAAERDRLRSIAGELLAALCNCVEHMEWSTPAGKEAYRDADETLTKARQVIGTEGE